MRMFYAVKFADYIKEALYNSLAEIQKHTLRGSFTDKNNFHVTLVFVGECEPNQIEDLRKVVDRTVSKLKLSAMNGVIEGLGTFARPGEELLWAGVKTNPENILSQINKTILEELAICGITTKDDGKKFTPHVTIARKVEFWRISSKDIKQIKFEPINFLINSITLMESVQEIKTNGGRTYNKIIYKPVYEGKF